MGKVSRKEQRKSLFKKGSDAREEAIKDSKAKHKAIEAAKPPPPPSKKRYILFVGNLPYNTTEPEIREHFKNCTIGVVRARSNGICFLEFTGENAANNMHHALQFHHTNFKNRKINVEFSAGGGGNSSNRRQKIKQKNEDFQKELKDRNEKAQSVPHRKFENQKNGEISKEEAEAKGINPHRLAALRK